jgi:hypothetical protein
LVDQVPLPSVGAAGLLPLASQVTKVCPKDGLAPTAAVMIAASTSDNAPRRPRAGRQPDWLVNWLIARSLAAGGALDTPHFPLLRRGPLLARA